MFDVKVKWSTPDAEDMLAYMAKVSNPAMQDEKNYEKLIGYLIRNDHWSPFEMVNMCVEINTTRDIGRQILRHRSFTFQEFSQRYAAVDALGGAVIRECRLQDNKNRQNSIETDDEEVREWWEDVQREHAESSNRIYQFALSKGIAKEQARVVLPEGMTPSRMYMNGNLRSWTHYALLRGGNGTQKEHQWIAVGKDGVKPLMEELFPAVCAAVWKETK